MTRLRFVEFSVLADNILFSVLPVRRFVQIDTVSEDEGERLSISGVRSALWLPSAVGHALAQVNLVVQGRTVCALGVAHDQSLIFTVDFQTTHDLVPLFIELADDGRVGRGSQVNHVPTLVVGPSGEMFAVGGDRERELILKLILLQQVGQIALDVVRNLGRVDRLHSVG